MALLAMIAFVTTRRVNETLEAKRWRQADEVASRARVYFQELPQKVTTSS
jgi:hypothetical protein